MIKLISRDSRVLSVVLSSNYRRLEKLYFVHQLMCCVFVHFTERAGAGAGSSAGEPEISELRVYEASSRETWSVGITQTFQIYENVWRIQFLSLFEAFSAYSVIGASKRELTKI